MRDTIDDYVITKVTDSEDCYSIMSDSNGFVLYKKYNVVPKVGDVITLQCKGFSHIRGMDINGTKIFYKTDEELEAHRLKERAKYEQKQIDDFEKSKSLLDAQYDSLPICFKQRIDKFRTNNPKFRVEYEAYELFCCMEAIKIANGCKTVENVTKFHKDSFSDEMKQLVPNLDDGHSGNTFGAACQLAIVYLQSPKQLRSVHGALAPLVGSADYGDSLKK
jgi:hypothetical protein